jgi:hypothetical protein
MTPTTIQTAACPSCARVLVLQGGLIPSHGHPQTSRECPGSRQAPQQTQA